MIVYYLLLFIFLKYIVQFVNCSHLFMAKHNHFFHMSSNVCICECLHYVCMRSAVPGCHYGQLTVQKHTWLLRGVWRGDRLPIQAKRNAGTTPGKLLPYRKLSTNPNHNHNHNRNDVDGNLFRSQAMCI